MSGFERVALEALLVVVTAAWVAGLTYAFWRLFEKVVVRPLRSRGMTGGQLYAAHLPVAVRRGGHHLDRRGNGATFRRAR
jgi:hypothetical protein